MRISKVRNSAGVVRALVLHISKEEYDSMSEGKGTISCEYTSAHTDIRTSCMWNRTLCVNGRMYVEGFTMVVE